MEAPENFDLYTWSVTYTEDGQSWRSELFRRADGARAFLREAVSRNEGNDRFSYFCERKVLANPADLLDEGVPEDRIRLVVNGALVSVAALGGEGA